MTQDNDSAPKSGATPDAASAPAKKTAVKKAPARKTAAKPAAGQPEAAAEKTKTPAKKPRAAAKATEKKTAAAKPAKPAARSKAKSAEPEASETAKPASPEEKAPGKTGRASAAKPSASEAKTASPKPAARARAAAKPAATAGPVTEATTAASAKTDAPEAGGTAEKAAPAKAKSSRAKQAKAEPAAPAAGAETEAAPKPADAPAEEKKSRTPRPSRAKTSAKQAPKPAEARVNEAADQPSPAGAADTQAQPPAETAPKGEARKTPPRTEAPAPDVPQGTPEASPPTSPAGSQEHPGGEGQNGEAAQAPARSRRSRRGGRRRNKSRNAANTAENGAAQGPDAREQAGTPEAATAAQPREADAAESPETAAPEPAKKESSRARQKPSAKQAAQKSGGRKGEKAVKAEAEEAEPAKSSGKRKMFISVLSGELVEVVLAEEGQVVEYYVEMQHQAKVKGNIYKGVVSNIDANLQAAFISYAGGVKNGFLQIDEVHPEYYLAHHDVAKGRKYPPIQKVLKPGQEILVQVVKEPAGTKGAFLTSYLSLPGRFLVLTPGREQIGVSRKVENDEERTRLRAMLEGLNPGKGLGVIVRTVSTGASKTSLQRDLQFLKRLWKDVRTKGQTSPAPSLIYEELDLSTRAVRDYLTEDVQEVWVDDAATAGQVSELAGLLFPKKSGLVQVHQESGQSLFERFSLQKQLDQIHSREVSLPSGGSLVIDKTEALTAIDINSGRSSGKSNFEDMAYRTNIEAARAIPLQLRLRDIGGQIVADFIEMRDRDHWREVEKAVRAGMKGDRARYDVGKIGPFGMLEIVRQRLGSSAISISTEPCPCCKGTGIRRNMEWQAMQCLREIGRKLRQASANNQASLTYQAEAELAFYLLNTKRSTLSDLEVAAGVTLVISPKTE